ncbi:MAG TPA: glycoside hydrolase family 88 protein [Candidatus Hungatella pullicola]|nr:glycoside hydrolase family 88 protein [Candidatus Hungatella pullicola]
METMICEKDRIEEAIDKIVKRTMQMDLSWNWQCGVAYYGICRAYEATKKQEYIDLLKNRIDEYIELGLPEKWTVNSCAMGHCLITLYDLTGEEKYRNLIMSKIDYLRHEALRFGDHVLQHTVSAKNDFPEQCWADTLFMAAYLMLRVGVKEKDEELINDALNQYYWHIQYLQNKDTGLWYHGYNNLTKDHMSAVHWGRANAWAAYTMSRVGDILPESYLYPQYMDVSGSLDELLTALKYYQTEQGLWRTVLDDEESYEEVSASCGIAAAMAVKGNVFHKKYVYKALEGVMANINENGKVMNVSAGTAVMRDKAAYREISRDWIQGWGQGLALAFLSQALKMQ